MRFFLQRWLGIVGPYDLAPLVAILCAAIAIFSHPQPLQWDEGIARFQLTWLGYPIFDSSITSCLMIGGFNRIFSVPEIYLDRAIRIFAMIFYVSCAHLLARRVLPKSWLWAAFFTLLLISRFPMLWLATELLAGGWLALGVLAVFAPWGPIATGITLALAGQSKVDLELVALCLLAYRGYEVWREEDSRSYLAYLGGSFATTWLALNCPGFLVHGWVSHFETRSYASFGQHYSHLIAKHQLIQPAPQPWEQYERYIQSIFPGTRTLGDVIRMHPRKYVDYVALSLVEAAFRMSRAFSWLLLFIPFRVAALKRSLSRLEKIALVTCIGLLPMIFVAALHVRYMARYAPIFFLVLLSHLQSGANPRLKKAVTLLLTAYVLLRAIGWSGDLRHWREIELFWFPD